MAQSASRFQGKLPDIGRWAQVAALLLLVGLLLAMAVGPLKQLVEQRKRISSVSTQLEELESNNEALRGRIERLQDPDYIEQRARAQAGLVRPGEIPFVVMPPSGDRRAEKDAARSRAEAAPPPEPGVLASFISFLGF